MISTAARVPARRRTTGRRSRDAMARVSVRDQHADHMPADGGEGAVVERGAPHLSSRRSCSWVERLSSRTGRTAIARCARRRRCRAPGTEAPPTRRSARRWCCSSRPPGCARVVAGQYSGARTVPALRLPGRSGLPRFQHLPDLAAAELGSCPQTAATIEAYGVAASSRARRSSSRSARCACSSRSRAGTGRRSPAPSADSPAAPARTGRTRRRGSSLERDHRHARLRVSP